MYLARKLSHKEIEMGSSSELTPLIALAMPPAAAIKKLREEKRYKAHRRHRLPVLSLMM